MTDQLPLPASEDHDPEADPTAQQEQVDDSAELEQPSPDAELTQDEEPVGDEPVADEPVVDEPVADEPVADEPVADEPVADQPEEPRWQRFDVTDPEQTDAALKAAVAAIRAGETIVLPTDTVYGIGAKAQDAAAVTRLLEAKQRGRDMPPPVLIADAAMAGAFVEDLPEYAEALATAFWPGPLTMILQAQVGLGMDLGDTNGTIAVRVPDHEFTRALLRRTGPLAVSSANISGQQASTTIDEAVDQLGNSVAVYLDAGATPGLVASSIVDFTVSTAGELVRLGVLDHGRLLAYAPLLKWDPPAIESAEPVAELEAAPASDDESDQDEPAQNESAEDEPAQDEPAQDEPAQDESAHDESSS